MQSGSYKVTARPASTTDAAPTDRRQINSKDTQNRGVSHKQESGCLPAPDTLTVVGGLIFVIIATALLGLLH